MKDLQVNTRQNGLSGKLVLESGKRNIHTTSLLQKTSTLSIRNLFGIGENSTEKLGKTQRNI